MATISFVPFIDSSPRPLSHVKDHWFGDFGNKSQSLCPPLGPGWVKVTMPFFGGGTESGARGCDTHGVVFVSMLVDCAGYIRPHE